MSKADHIIAIASKNPCLTLAQVGRAVGVSGEYVRLVANKHDLLPYRHNKRERNPNTPRCSVCGKMMFGRKKLKTDRLPICFSCRRVTLTCTVCLKYFTRRLSVLRSATSERGYRSAFLTCSRACFAYRMGGPIQGTCYVCGEMFILTPRQKYRQRYSGSIRFGCPEHGKQMMALNLKEYRARLTEQRRKEKVSAKGML